MTTTPEQNETVAAEGPSEADYAAAKAEVAQLLQQAQTQALYGALVASRAELAQHRREAPA